VTTAKTPSELRKALAARVVIADGAMGTMLQAADPSLEDFQGHEGCNEILVDTRPELIRQMHSEYFAGIAKYDYAGISRQLDSSSTASFTVIRFGVDDILNTTQLIDSDGNIDYNRVSKFSTADYGFSFSYARKSKFND
jgi:hypothetical protein